MGRQVKRVALDFDWPLEQVWEGYRHGHYERCLDRPRCATCARLEPPAGEGWQVWETITEGSPVSPVFATPEALAEHMAADLRYGCNAGRDEWLLFIRDAGQAPTLVIDQGAIRHGVAS